MDNKSSKEILEDFYNSSNGFKENFRLHPENSEPIPQQNNCDYGVLFVDNIDDFISNKLTLAKSVIDVIKTDITEDDSIENLLHRMVDIKNSVESLIPSGKGLFNFKNYVFCYFKNNFFDYFLEELKFRIPFLEDLFSIFEKIEELDNIFFNVNLDNFEDFETYEKYIKSLLTNNYKNNFDEIKNGLISLKDVKMQIWNKYDNDFREYDFFNGQTNISKDTYIIELENSFKTYDIEIILNVVRNAFFVIPNEETQELNSYDENSYTKKVTHFIYLVFLGVLQELGVSPHNIVELDKIFSKMDFEDVEDIEDLKFVFIEMLSIMLGLNGYEGIPLYFSNYNFYFKDVFELRNDYSVFYSKIFTQPNYLQDIKTIFKQPFRLENLQIAGAYLKQFQNFSFDLEYLPKTFYYSFLTYFWKDIYKINITDVTGITEQDAENETILQGYIKGKFLNSSVGYNEYSIKLTFTQELENKYLKAYAGMESDDNETSIFDGLINLNIKDFRVIEGYGIEENRNDFKTHLQNEIQKKNENFTNDLEEKKKSYLFYYELVDVCEIPSNFYYAPMLYGESQGCILKESSDSNDGNRYNTFTTYTKYDENNNEYYTTYKPFNRLLSLYGSNTFFNILGYVINIKEFQLIDNDYVLIKGGDPTHEETEILNYNFSNIILEFLTTYLDNKTENEIMKFKIFDDEQNVEVTPISELVDYLKGM